MHISTRAKQTRYTFETWQKLVFISRTLLTGIENMIEKKKLVQVFAGVILTVLTTVSSIAQNLTITSPTSVTACAGSTITVAFSLDPNTNNSKTYPVTVQEAFGSSTTFSNTTTSINVNTNSDVAYTRSIAVLIPAGNTTYKIRLITDKNNGNGTVTTGQIVTVTVNPLPTPAITASGSTSFCQGGSVTLTSSTASSYQWRLNGTAISGQTNQSINVTTAGNYSVTVTSSAGCIATSTTTAVTVNPLPATPTITASGATTFCQGGSVTLTSSTASSYQWRLNGTAISGQTNQSINVTTAGNYSVTVTSSAGCTATSTTTAVTVNPLPTATLSGSQAINAGQSASFSVALTGTPPWSITYSNGGTPTTVTTSANPYTLAVSPAAVGTYTYSLTAVSDANCTGTASGSATVAVYPTGPLTLYTYMGGGDWNTPNTWTQDNTGTISIGAVVPRTSDNVVILNGATVTGVDNNQGANVATICKGGTLDLGTSTGITFGTLQGSATLGIGTLRISSATANAVFPSVTTNRFTFLAGAGSTVEYYYTSTNFALPASITSYRNLVVSGGGIVTVPNAILAINEDFTLQGSSFNVNNDIYFNGNFTNNGGAFNQTGTTTAYFGAGKSVAMTGTSPVATNFANVVINASGLVTNSIDFSVSGDLNVSAAFTVTAGTISLTRAGVQSIVGSTAPLSFYNLTISGSNVKSINRNFAVTNNLTINSTLQYPASGSYSVTAKNLLLSSGTAAFNMATPPALAGATTHDLSISGNLTNNGTVDLDNGNNVCNTTLNGVAQNVGGSGTTTFYGLVNNNANTILTGKVTVDNVLTLTQGVIDLGNFNLELASTATIGGNTPNSTNMVRASGTGNLRKYYNLAALNTSFTFPVGTGNVYTPATVTTTSAVAVVTPFIEVRPVAGKLNNQLDATYSLSKYWIANASNFTSINTALTFKYDPSERSTTAEPLYVPAYSSAVPATVTPASSWNIIPAGGISGSVTNQTITINNFTSGGMSAWTALPRQALIPTDFYSIKNGTYENATTWVTGSASGPAAILPPTDGANVYITNNTLVSVTSGNKVISNLRIDAGAELDLGIYTNIAITGTLSGSSATAAGTLSITSTAGTAAYPAVTTAANDKFSSIGTVKYYGATSYNLPSSPGAYGNLIVRDGGTKTLSASITVNNNLSVAAGTTFEVTDDNVTVTGTTQIAGSFSDNNDAGSNTFGKAVTVSSGGSFVSGNKSPFTFLGGVTNNGTFNQSNTGAAVTFSTNSQTIDGSAPITLAGAVKLDRTTSASMVVTNKNSQLAIYNLQVLPGTQLLNTYTGFPTAYTAFSNGAVATGKFTSLGATSNTGNQVSSNDTTGIVLSRNGGGNAYAAKTIDFAPASQVMVVRFNIAKVTTTTAATSAVTLLLGNGFTDDATRTGSVTDSLQINLVAGNQYSLSRGSTTLTNSNADPTVTWLVNTTNASANYIGPDSTTTQTLASNRADIWVGKTKAGSYAITSATAMSDFKIIFTRGAGSVQLKDIHINPLGNISLDASALSAAACITPYAGATLNVPFIAGNMKAPVSAMTAGTHFNNLNTFYAQLIDSTGKSRRIGVLTSTALSGTIVATVPQTTPAGTYKLRVVSNDPVSDASSNTVAVKVYTLSPYASQSFTTVSSGTLLTAAGPEVTNYTWGYYTQLGGPFIPLTGQSGPTKKTYTPNGQDFPGAGTYSVVCQMTTSNACGTVISNEVVVYVNCPTPTPTNYNLIKDGDFSQAYSNVNSSANFLFSSEYQYTNSANGLATGGGGGGEGKYAIGVNPQYFHPNFCSFSGSNPMLIANGTANSSQAVWKQTITVVKNTDYVLTFDAVSLAGDATSLFFGVYVGCARTGANVSVPYKTANCQWNKYTFQFNSGSTTSLDLAIRNISVQASGNDIAIDNLELYACPATQVAKFPIANPYTWQGITNEWNKADNWGCNVPTCQSDITIPVVSSGIYPVITASSSAGTVTIASGATLTINAGQTLNICGDLINNGRINAADSTATVVFIGNNAQQTVSGNLTVTNTSASGFGKVIINKTSAAGLVQMNSAMDVAGTLLITSGNLNTGGNMLRVGGNFINNSTFTPGSGTVEMNGLRNQQFLQSTAATGQFYNLTINKGSASNTTVTFNPAVTTITNQLTLTSGIAVTSTREIFVSNSSPAAVSGGSVNSYVSGLLRRAVSGTQLYNFPVGVFTTVGNVNRYAPIQLNITNQLAAGGVPTSSIVGTFNGTNLTGTLSLQEAGATYSQFCSGGYWSLTPNVDITSGAYDVVIYPDNTFGCLGSGQSVAKRHNGGAWSFDNSLPVSATRRNGFTSFSDYAQISTGLVPLPVRLLNFSGTLREGVTSLTWETASEENNDYFEVERSVDMIRFDVIGRIKGAGTSKEKLAYAFNDQNPKEGTNYYRLRQVDINGLVNYSYSISVENTLEGDKDRIVLAPNPASRGLNAHLLITSSLATSYEITVMDTQGKEVARQIWQVTEGENDMVMNENLSLPAGMYLIRVAPVDATHTTGVRLLKLLIQ